MIIRDLPWYRFCINIEFPKLVLVSKARVMESEQH
uniref:Uncharacterized protein n=1 Tax=Anguilla anguilla TaxID=7936 RepID=A0A0E9VQJ4_ANGAN